MSFLVSRRGATFCFRENVYFRYDFAKIVIYFGENENTKLEDSNQIVTQKAIVRL
jgi:hypothetical protein